MKFAALALVLVAACGGDSTGPGVTVSGTWHLQTIDGAQLPVSTTINGQPVTITADVLTMAQNGTYTDQTSVVSGSVTATRTEAGTWTAAAGSVTFDDQTDGILYAGSVSGNTLTEIIGTSTQVYTR